MEQSGSLKKRRRRPIAKVTGLTILPYDESADVYRGLDVYGIGIDEPLYEKAEARLKRRQSSSSITISRIREARNNGRLSSSTRVTRDPWFSHEGDEDDDIERKLQDQLRIPVTDEVYRIPMKTKEALDRPIFVDFGVIWTLKSWILLGISTISFPWSWNSKTLRIDKWKAPFDRIWEITYGLAITQIILLTGYQFYQFMEKLKGHHDTYREGSG